MTQLILPHHKEFHLTLGNIPFFFQSLAQKTFDFAGWVADADSGLVRPCTRSELIDYMYGGEYEERLRNDGYDPELEFRAMGDISEVQEFYIDL